MRKGNGGEPCSEGGGGQCCAAGDGVRAVAPSRSAAAALTALSCGPHGTCAVTKICESTPGEAVKRLDAAAGHRIDQFHYGTDCSLHFRRPAALKRIRESVSPVASPLGGSARRARSKWWETGGLERGCGEGARTPVPYVYAVAPRRLLGSRSVHETIKITSPAAGCRSGAGHPKVGQWCHLRARTGHQR